MPTMELGKSWLDPYLAALIAIIGIFVAFKIPYLDMPFFWDEAWVYAPAIKAMHQVGPGLLPDTITPDLTRGHPLLFHFLCSIWINVFGSSRTSLHAFALGISIGLLIVSYLLAVRLGTKQVGIGAVLMIAANEMFLAQSGILLPEVMLAFFCVLSVYFYSARKPVLFVIVAVCALMTKESAIVLILSLLCWQVYCCLDRGVVQPGSLEGRWLFIIPLPVLIASFYFVYQKVALGWFFYPAHVDMITWEPLDVIYKIKLGYVDIFEQQGQVIATYAFAFLAPVAWRWWNRWLSLLVIALYVSIGKILFGKWEFSLPWTVPAILVCIAIIFWFFFRSLRERAKNIAEVASIAFISTVGFLGFSALNFFTDRYLVCLIPFVALGIMLIMETVLKDHHHLLFPFFAGLVFFGLLFNVGRHELIRDTTLSYTDAISVEKQVIGFCETHGLYKEPICTSFMEQVYMNDPEAGYRSTSERFSSVSLSITPSTAFAIFTNATPGEDYEQRENLGFILVKRFECGNAWSEFYQRPNARVAIPRS